MQKYIRKPVPIVAIQMLADAKPKQQAAIDAFIDDSKQRIVELPNGSFRVSNNTGYFVALKNDWIFIDERGEYQTMRPGVFTLAFDAWQEPAKKKKAPAKK